MARRPSAHLKNFNWRLRFWTFPITDRFIERVGRRQRRLPAAQSNKLTEELKPFPIGMIHKQTARDSSPSFSNSNICLRTSTVLIITSQQGLADSWLHYPTN
jgi:hypothetical protein